MVQKVAVLGTGKVTRRSVVTMVEDTLHEIEGDHRLVLPVPEKASPLMRYVSEWAMDTGVPVEAVIGKEDSDDPTVDEIVESSVRAHVVKDSWVDTLVGLLNPGDKILMAYGEGDEDSDRVLALAAKLDVDCYDLTDGMTKLVWEDEDEPQALSVGREDDSVESEDEAEEPARRKPVQPDGLTGELVNALRGEVSPGQLLLPAAVEPASATEIVWHPEVGKIVTAAIRDAMHQVTEILDDMQQRIFSEFAKL